MPDLIVTAGLAALNRFLGLPPLIRSVCHGYAAACVCSDCSERERLNRAGPENTIRVRQPWEAWAESGP